MKPALHYLLAAAYALMAGAVMPATASDTPTTQPAMIELRPILSAEAKRQAARELIDRFVAHVNASPAIDASARDAIAEGWQRHRDDEDPQDFLTAGIAILSKDFETAINAMEDEDHATADAALAGLVDVDDPYIALHAAALLARSYVEQDKLEEAEAILAPLAQREAELIDKTFLEMEVDFLLGYCQLSNLKYEEAQATLERFERDHPDAPDRFRLPARQMLQELLVRLPEGLGEVSDLMVYAGRRLAMGEPGPPVQVRQERAVELLSKLIEEAEQREQQSKGQGKGCKECEGKGCEKCEGADPQGAWQPGSPAQQSMLPGGRGEIGDLKRSPTARPGEEWGQMRPEEREQILQSLRRNFPSQYRQLVEQYYKQLGRER
jgi:tetratricopeptide (TPR) repeat protein